MSSVPEISRDIVFIKKDNGKYQVELTEEQFNSIDRSVKRHYKQLDSKIRHEEERREKLSGDKNPKKINNSRLPRWKFIVQDNSKIKDPKIMNYDNNNNNLEYNLFQVKNDLDKIFEKLRENN